MLYRSAFLGLMLSGNAAFASAAEHCEARPLPEPGPQYHQYVKDVHQTLGIPDHYKTDTELQLQAEQDNLKVVDIDINQEVFLLTPEAKDAWLDMQAAARMDGVVLTLVSTFRSVRRQADIIKSRRNKGEPLKEILETSTAPGYSEHHTGDAIDFTTRGLDELSEEFADTTAFKWLKENAERFCFELSYPEDNQKGIAFEPWHWRFIRAE